MVCLSFVVLNPSSLQILFLLIRVFSPQDLDVTLHLIGDSGMAVQGRLGNLCSEEQLTLKSKVAVTSTAKPSSEWCNLGQNGSIGHLLCSFGRLMENRSVGCAVHEKNSSAPESSELRYSCSGRVPQSDLLARLCLCCECSQALKSVARALDQLCRTASSV